MKRCPYCGKEYPDEVVKCFIGGHSLPEIVLQAPSSKKQPNVPCQALDSAGAVPDSKPERKHEPVLTYPDYSGQRVMPGNAWECASSSGSCGTQAFLVWAGFGPFTPGTGVGSAFFP